MSRFENGLIALIALILAASVALVIVFSGMVDAKTHDKVEKVGKTVTEQTWKDVNKELKKLGKLEIPAGTYTDIELADLIRAAFGASLVPKKEKVKK